MDSCQSSNLNNAYKIVEHDKFVSTLKECARNELLKDSENLKEQEITEAIEEQLSMDLDITSETVHKWLTNVTHPRNSDIKKIIKRYNISPSKLGVTCISKEELTEKSKKKNELKIKIGKKITELLKQNGKNQQDLVKALGFNKSKISKWCNGKNIPEDNELIKIADFFNVSLSYLKCQTHTKNADNEIICKTLQIDEKAAESLKNNKNISQYGKKQQKEFKENFGITYSDISNFLINSDKLKKVLYQEAISVLTYYTSSNYREKYEDAINEIELELTNNELDLDNSIPIHGATPFLKPYRKDIDLSSKALLSEEIQEVFDEYIDLKIQDNNLQLVRKEKLLFKESQLKEQLKYVQDELAKIEKEELQKKKK